MNVEMLNEIIKMKNEIIKAEDNTLNSMYEIIKSKDLIIELLEKQNIEMKIIRNFKLKSGKFS